MKSVVTFSAAVATLAFSLPSVAQQANNPQSPMTSAYNSARQSWYAGFGVGESKLARYGEAALEVVRGFEG